MSIRVVLLSAISIAFVHICPGQNALANVDLIQNWPAPRYWQPASGHSAAGVNDGRMREQVSGKVASSLGPLATFVAMTPCRVVDTRVNTNPYPFGPPAFAAGEIRIITMTSSATCTIPAGAVAYSVNIAVVPIPPESPMRWLTAWDTGSPQPSASTLNDKAGLITSNSAVVPAGTGGSINIFTTDATDVVIDINGYYAPPSDMYGNTAVGTLALQNNTTGSGNTASGGQALYSNTTGNSNTASGGDALVANTTGSGNTAYGFAALVANTTGIGNIAIGFSAATNVSSGNSNNIHIGSQGSAADSGAIRIGTPGTQISFFAAGVRGVTTGGNDTVPVLIDSAGQLGTVSSSRRFKEDIRDMGDASRGLMHLRPVTFRYQKPFADGSKPIQYGLIGEEVAEVYPDLVAHSADGQIETVKYQVLEAMLLNEVQRQQGIIEQQRHEIEGLKAPFTVPCPGV